MHCVMHIKKNTVQLSTKIEGVGPGVPGLIGSMLRHSTLLTINRSRTLKENIQNALVHPWGCDKALYKKLVLYGESSLIPQDTPESHHFRIWDLTWTWTKLT